MHLLQTTILSLPASMRQHARVGIFLPSFVIMALLLCSCTPPCVSQVRDLSEMPQQPAAYLDRMTATTPLVDRSAQHRVAQHFLTRYFSPWHACGPLEETQHPFWALEWLESNEVFGHNLLPLENKAVTRWQQRCAVAEYPSMTRYAISVAHTDVRALPTAAPMFNDPRQTGEGFPFDYLQHGVLPAGTPLLITHTSQEGNWLFIETPLLYGWVPATAVARVDDAFKDAYISTRYVAVLEDGHRLRSTDGGALPPTRAGSILPVLDHTESGYVVAVPHINAQGKAIMGQASISRDIARPFPLPFTPAQVAQRCSYFMHQPYSWGDRFHGRDCSGTMRDLFTPFGIWLPRNSGDQSMVGRIIDLEETPAPQRRVRIASQAIPFATLLHMRGHIMLYLGEYEDRSVVLHTVWGIRTRSPAGTEGRIRIGKTAITSLEPGKEKNGIWCRISSLLERLDQMNVIHQRSTE